MLRANIHIPADQKFRDGPGLRGTPLVAPRSQKPLAVTHKVTAEGDGQGGKCV